MPLHPHIFTTEQMMRLLGVAAPPQLRSDTLLCPRAFRLAIVLLYTAGVRRGDLVRLVLGDLDRNAR